MDVSKIKEHLPIYAEGQGGLEGASDTYIGVVDKVEGKYIKMSKHSAADGQHHWLPLDLVRAVDERAVYLNIIETEVADKLLNEQPGN